MTDCNRCGDETDDPIALETWSRYIDTEWPLCDSCYSHFLEWVAGED